MSGNLFIATFWVTLPAGWQAGRGTGHLFDLAERPESEGSQSRKQILITRAASLIKI